MLDTDRMLVQTAGMRASTSLTAPTYLGTEDPGLVLQAYPPTLPVELALRIASPREICEAHGISREEFERLRLNPAFVADLTAATEAVRKEGASFRMKARIQAEELLKTSWKMIHDPVGVPATVRADLLKFTVRVAGLDAGKDADASKPVGLSIQINLG